MVASMHRHMAFILIPLNSLSTVCASILWVAAIVLVSRSFRVFVKVVFLLYIFPRYLYLGTSSSAVLLSVILLSWPGPILTTLHFAAPNSIWYFLRRGLWCPSFPVGLSGPGGWGTRHPSTVGSSAGFPVLFVGLYYYFLVLWLFHLLGLRILLPIGLLLVGCCLWFLFLLLVHV